MNDDSDAKAKAKGKETISVTNKTKRFTPKQIAANAMNKEKADKFKNEIRYGFGVKTVYWNHTKNYSKIFKQDEQTYVEDHAKKYPVRKFLRYFEKKAYHYMLLRKFVREYFKKQPFNEEERKLVG